MPYKVFVAGEEALASDVNGFLMSQTVPRFTDATQRSSQLTAPVTNQLSMLASRPSVIQYWNGSAWADTDPLMQRVSAVSYTTNAGGDVAVTFPTPFASAAVTVLITNNFPNYAAILVVRWDFITANGFAFQVQNIAGPVANQAFPVSWLAIGPRV